MKKLPLFFRKIATAILFLSCVSVAIAQPITIYSESFGPGTGWSGSGGSSWPNLSSECSILNFDNLCSMYSGQNIDFRNNQVSSNGGGNAFFGGQNNNELKVSGISTLGYANIKISFLVWKTGSNSVNGDLFIVEYSEDNITYYPITFPTLSNGQVWHSVEPSTILPATGTLYLKFKKTANSSVQFRLDNIIILGEDDGNPHITITSPAALNTNVFDPNLTINFNVTNFDLTTEGAVAYSISNSIGTTNGLQNDETPITFNLEEGLNTISLELVDNSEAPLNPVAVAIRNVTYIQPAITITSPIGTVNIENVILSYTYNTIGVYDDVSYVLDGGAEISATNGINLGTLSAGSHTIKVILYDNIQQLLDYDEVTFTCTELQIPKITITTTETEYITTDEIVIEYEVSNITEYTVKYKIDNGAKELSTENPQNIGTISSPGAHDVMFILYEEEDSVSYDVIHVNVSPAPPVEELKLYELVTSNDDFIDGANYLIVSNSAYFALGYNRTSNKNRLAVPISIGNKKIFTAPAIEIITNDPTHPYEIKLEETAEGFALKDVVNAKYLFAPSNSANQIELQSSPSTWSLDVDGNGLVTVINTQTAATHNYMRFNPNSGSPLFSCYLSTSTVGTKVSFYKEVSGTTPYITIISPEENANIPTTSVNVELAVLNFNLAVNGKIKWIIDNSVSGFATNNNFTIPDLSAGTHTLKCELVDMSETSFNPQVLSEEISFKITAIIPTITITSPQNNDTFDTESITVKVDVNNFVLGQDGKIKCILDGVELPSLQTTNQFNISGLTVGTHVFKCELVDMLGISLMPIAVSNVVSFEILELVPSIKIISPTNGYQVLTSTVNVTLDVHNFILGVDGKIKWSLNGVDDETLLTEPTFSISNLTNGSYDLYCELVDMNGDPLPFSDEISFTVLISGIFDVLNEDICIYPNPANNYFTISTSEEVNIVSITNISGQTVKVVNNSKIIDIQDLTSGMYFVNVKSKENSKILKLIVQ